MPTQKHILVTTTPSLDGYKVTEYCGILSAHVVTGTSVLSDVFASFSDFFGGRSRSYQKELDAIHEEAVGILKEKAARIRANCLLGLRIDHDQISSKNVAMFMVTATATAAIIEAHGDQDVHALTTSTRLSAEELIRLARRQKIIEKAEAGQLKLDEIKGVGNKAEIDEELWTSICDDQIHEAGQVVLDVARKALGTSAEKIASGVDADTLLAWCRRYFEFLPDDECKQLLYPAAVNGEARDFEFALEILRARNLLDLGAAAEMLQHEAFGVQKRALAILLLHKAVYTKEDAGYLQAIHDLILAGFPKRGGVMQVKGMLSSKHQLKWQCECGAKVGMKESTCPECFRDTYGFNTAEVKPQRVLDLLARRIAVLQAALPE